MSDFNKILRDTSATISKHSPEILTALGVTGMVVTTVIAVKSTPKALELIDKRKKELNAEKLPVVDVVKTTWKCYIPTVISGGFAIGCVVGANHINLQQKAALSAAYAITETALLEYKDKVIETIGEKKEESIRESILKDKLEEKPVSTTEVIITDRGDTLCYDCVSGRYFYSNQEFIRKVENKLNKRLRNEMYISLNELYYELGLSLTKLGNDLGWNVNDGDIDIRFSAQLAENDQPCLVMDYLYGPRYDFRNLL